jgi:hypothetical protein
MKDPGDDIYHGFPDHERFCNESLMVQNKLGKLVPMYLGPAQKRLAQIVAKCQAKHKPVRIVCPKARQVWVSVGVAAHFFHGTPFISGQHTLVLANDQKTALNLMGHYARFYENYKPFASSILLPGLVKQNTTEMEWDNGAWIQCHTTRTLTIGRSFVLRRVHFSEAAYYADLKTTMASVMQAVPDDSNTMVVVESTANGVGNEFHRLCLSAAAGDSDWQLFFFAWWEHPEYARQIEGDRARFQTSLSADEREILRQYKLTLEQLNWRRWCIRNKLAGDAELFKQEYPSNFEEAFLASGRPRFDYQAVSRMPLVHDAAVGGLERNLYAGTHRLAFLPREHGELKLFFKPDPAKTYVIGADSAEGIDANEGHGESDPDWAVAVVRERETGDQAATLRARMEPGEFGRYLALLGWYFNNACIVPEANGPGIATIDALLNADYAPGLIYHRRREADDDPQVRADKVGWKTTSVTRPQLISWYDAAIRELSITIRDPVVAQECRTFVIKPNGRAEAQKACHDDCVIADALTVVGMQQMPKPEAPGARTVAKLTNYRRPVDSGDARDLRGEKVRLR